MNKFTQNLISPCGEDFQYKTRENISTFILWLQYLRCPQSNICGFCRKEGRFQRLYWQTVCQKKNLRQRHFCKLILLFPNKCMNQLVLTLSIIHNGRKNDVNRGKVGAGSHLLIFIKFHQERKIFCEDKAITVWRVQGFQLFMVGFFQLQVEGGWVDGSAVWKSNPNFIFFLRFEILCLMHIIFWRNIYFFLYFP